MSRRGLLLGAWFAAMAAALWWLITGMDDWLRSDLTLFMPAGDNIEERLLLDELREGPAGRLILLGIEGGKSAERACISRQLANQLPSTGLFTRVNNGAQQLNADDWRQLSEYRYLLSAKVSAETFTVSALRDALTERMQELASPLSALYARLIPADPSGELQILEQQLRPSQQPRILDGVWASIDGKQALLLAETHAASFDLNAQEQAVETIRSGFAALEPSSDLQLLLSGPGVYGVMSRDVIRSESSLLSLAASVLVAVILFIGYRSFPLILLGVLPVATALVAGATAVILWFGTIHGITLAFGITLLGMTIDYPIHLFSHLGPGEEPKVGLRRIWPTLRLSALTSSVAFIVIMTTGFGGLGQLGLFTLAGLAAAALFTRWLMPEFPGVRRAARAHDDSVRGPRLIHPGGANCGVTALSYLTRSASLIIIGLTLLVSLLWLWIQRDQLWEDDLAALSPIPQHLINQDRELRQQLNAPEVSHLLIVTADSAEQALQQAEALQARLQTLQRSEVIRDSELLTRMLPSVRTQLQRQAQLPDPDRLRDNLALAMEEIPYRAGTFEPFLVAVEKSRTLPPLTPQQTTGTLFGTRVESLLHCSASGWLLMIPLAGVQDPQALERAFNQQPPSNVRYINLKNQTARFVSKFRDEALYRLGWGALLMVTVLLIALRSPRRVVRALLPVTIALSIDVALLLALGQRLSLFHLVSLLLVVGISLDYSLFINRPKTDRRELCHTLHSLTVCVASTAAVFGLLALSELPVLKAIGSTVVIGVISGYIVSLALSPGGVKSA